MSHLTEHYLVLYILKTFLKIKYNFNTLKTASSFGKNTATYVSALDPHKLLCAHSNTLPSQVTPKFKASGLTMDHTKR